ncbi:hypothetical protein [Herpetosiphon giganteus]|uniref:hypothetical protein n=1 Tax=Herpetosiphon giganteus TaxID=2029754 RepID=UPI0019599A59|nr:hypothetical protein [Herpetosiphon giganteus]MBM7844311.1 hypothetical protein [Herpetosiphon giganteus]
MQPEYHVPANRSPYRWRMIIRIVLALGIEVYYGFFMYYRLTLYQDYIARGGTFEQYISIRPFLWALLPLSLAMVCVLIGLVRDSWMLSTRRRSSALLPIPYIVALVLIGLAAMIYVESGELRIYGS